MKIIPIILCGGSGVRLNLKNNKDTPKQFIDFGNWTLFDKTLERIHLSKFSSPIISTNKNYLKKIRFFLKKHNFKNYKIILEPIKKKHSSCNINKRFIKGYTTEPTTNFFFC